LHNTNPSGGAYRVARSVEVLLSKRPVRIHYILMTLLLVPPTSALAQSRVPAEGSMAAGADAGFFAPADDDLDLAPIVAGFFEYYFTPRLSIRPGVAFLDSGFDIGDPDDSLRQVRVGADLIYNWERGEWHPFAGGGLSVHSLRLKDNGHAFGDSEQQLGVSGLGGVEYFFRRRTSLKFEGRVQFVDDAFGTGHGGVSGTAGVKWYF
jgi:Outer membrane protein beta-barrel domain